jgi:hypothetical protein
MCQAWLIEGVFDPAAPSPCPACGNLVRVEVFPAFFRPAQAGREGEALIAEGESSCFFHPQKKAVLPCEGCGRFLCALCDCELNGRHFCPSCLEVGAAKGKIWGLENSRLMYDSVALALSIYPLLMPFLTVITAPMAIFVSVRYWNAPGSIVRRSKSRHIAAVVIAIFQLAGWAGLAGYYILESRSHG